MQTTATQATPAATDQRVTTRTEPSLALLLDLARRVARLNPDADEIGPGMLAGLVGDARRALGRNGGAA